MKLQHFNGGLSTRKASHLIEINEAITFTNIDTEQEILEPVKALAKLGETHTTSSAYVDYEDDILALAKVPHTLLEYKNRLYYSVLGDFVQCKTATTEGDLGLYPPVITDSETVTILPDTPTAADIVITEEEYAAPNTYKSVPHYFAITEVVDGVESLPYFFTHTPVSTLGSKLLFTPQNGKALKLYKRIDMTWYVMTYHAGCGLLSTPHIFTSQIVDLRANWVGAIQSFCDSYGENLWNTADWDYKTYDWEIVSDPYSISAAGLPESSYSYVATVYSSELGWESAPSSIRTIAIAGTELLTLTIDVIDPDARIDQLIVYRIGEVVTDFTKVYTEYNPTFPVRYTDNVQPLDSAGNKILASENHDKPMSGITNLAIAGSQLVGTLGTKLYFSEIGKPYAIPPANYRDFRETLTGTYVIDSGLLVFSATKTWLINTSNIAVGKVIRLSDEFGCTSHKSITGYKTGAIWHSLAGLASSFGGKVEVLTKDKIGYQDLSLDHAVMYNEVYYGFTTLGDCYAFDLRYAPACIKHFNFAALEDDNNATEIRQVYLQNNVLKLLFGSTSDVDSYTVFGSVNNEEWQWTSPRFIEGAYTELKNYNNIYIRATAGVNFKAYIDDVKVVDIDFIKEETKDIAVPQDLQDGYSIYFEASGTGTIYELEYKTMGRTNGR